MIDYEIVVTVDDAEVDLAHDEFPEGSTFASAELVSQETGLSDEAIIELIRKSNSPSQLNERLDNLDNLELSDAEISNLDRDLAEVADNVDSVYIYNGYSDWLESQDYIVDVIRNTFSGGLGEIIVDSLDPEKIFDANDQSTSQVMPSGKIIEYGYE